MILLLVPLADSRGGDSEPTYSSFLFRGRVLQVLYASGTASEWVRRRISDDHASGLRSLPICEHKNSKDNCDLTTAASG